MKPPSQPQSQLFDRCASHYQTMLDRALAPSGEAAPFFARTRVERLRKCLRRLDFTPGSVLDYGCGIGGAVPFLKQMLHPRRILGVDVSPESLRQAQQEHGGEGVEFADCRSYCPRSEFDLGFSNGVFHHIGPGERPAALRYIYDSLVPGGLLAFWENNPWNPATRYIMGRCEFDQQAQPISSRAAANLLQENGFQVLHGSTHFYFPRWLKGLRGLEPALAHLPLGAQYLLLARKPR